MTYFSRCLINSWVPERCPIVSGKARQGAQVPTFCAGARCPRGAHLIVPGGPRALSAAARGAAEKVPVFLGVRCSVGGICRVPYCYMWRSYCVCFVPDFLEALRSLTDVFRAACYKTSEKKRVPFLSNMGLTSGRSVSKLWGWSALYRLPKLAQCAAAIRLKVGSAPENASVPRGRSPVRPQ